jgi:serine/threonine protein kinase
MTDLSGYVLKISDMGLGKQLTGGQSSFGLSSHAAGTTAAARAQFINGNGTADAAAAAKDVSSVGGHVGSVVSHFTVLYKQIGMLFQVVGICSWYLIRLLLLNMLQQGWQAPEVISDRVRFDIHSDGSNQASSSSDIITAATATTTAAPASSRRTQAVDIFSLGCIFHHCLCPGSHPFGDWYEVCNNYYCLYCYAVVITVQ